jgi:hypothetical protein
VARTDPKAAAQALTGSVRRRQVWAAGLLSDGAEQTCRSVRLATWEDALKTRETLGPRELLRQVREADRSDPHGSCWQRRKVHDDATAAYCSGVSGRMPVKEGERGGIDARVLSQLESG